MKTIALGLLAAALSVAAQPVKLSPQPQKFRMFFALDDPRVPPALSNAPDAVTASDGVKWRGTPEGLWRGRGEYFAGQRYLADDDVQHLLPDPSGGIWVGTRTGVSHIELRPMTMAAKAALFEMRVQPAARPPRPGVSFELASTGRSDDQSDARPRVTA